MPFTDTAGLTWDIGPDGRLTSWVTAAATAEELGITTRRLQQLERLGMPARGYRGSCRYPWPHARIWFWAYHDAIDSHERVTHLAIEEVMAQHDLQNATEDIEFENELRRDPAMRKRVIELELEEWCPLVVAIELGLLAARHATADPPPSAGSSATTDPLEAAHGR